MGLLTPLALVAMAGLAVPVLLHLVQRERSQLVKFPSLMFLKRIPYESVRRRRLRHLALLATRLGLLLLAILAFARPFLRGAAGAALTAGPRELVVLLDRSYSMQHGSRWARAQEAADRALAGMRPGDRATLVLFAADAEAGARSSPDGERLRADVRAARPSAGSTRYGPALRLAQAILAASRLSRREVVLVSDFQKSGWMVSDAMRLPPGTVVTPVDVARRDEPNVAIAGVTLQRSSLAGQERATATAAVFNAGNAEVADLDVMLELDGRPAASQKVTVAPHGSASAVFPPFTIPDEGVRATVRTTADALGVDNVFHLVAAPSQVVPVLLAAPEGRGNPSLYLSRAMDVSTAPRFEVSIVRLDGLEPRRFGPGTVLVLNGVAPAGRGLDTLRAALEAGTGVLVVAGDDEWGPDAVSVLPGLLSEAIDRSTTGAGLITSVDASYPAVAPLRELRRSGFAAARFFQYRRLAAGNDARVVARFDDGNVALAERAVGRGRIVVWASSLDTLWNDLALRPVFVPFVHGLLRHLAGFVDVPPAFTVGQIVQPATLGRSPGKAAAAAGAASVTVRTPTGAQSVVSATAALPLAEAGFYELRGDGTSTAVAVNVDRGESDLTRLVPEELAASVAGDPGAATAAAGPVTAEDEEHRSGFWWYLLLAALVLLTIESVLANRLATAPVR